MVSFDEIMSQPGSVIVAYHPRSSDQNYSVKVGLPSGTTKFYPNVKVEKLKEYVRDFREEGLLDGSEGSERPETPQKEDKSQQEEKPRQRGHHYSGKSFMDYMNEGGKITEYHQTKIGYYSVHVVHPSGIEDTFSNISPEHFQQFYSKEAEMRYPEEWSIRPHRVGDTFEKVMSEGGQIMDKKEFPSNSVHIQMPASEGGGFEFFSNISPERLEKYSDRINLSQNLAKDSGEYHHQKGNRFETCMEKGGIIVGVDTHPFYSVHVRTSDGNLEFYSHVGQRTLDKFKNSK